LVWHGAPSRQMITPSKVLYRVKLASIRAQRVLFGERCDRVLDFNWKLLPGRGELINAIIRRNRAGSYLEIGCRADRCFSSVDCPRKVGVDPVSGGTVRLTSDEYFQRHPDRFDIIFIDGLHLFEQVSRDMQNALACLNDGGTILVHDCLPLNIGAQSRRVEQTGSWNGDVWKAIVKLRTRADVDTAVCAIDHGIAVIKNRPNRRLLEMKTTDFLGLRFCDFTANYENWLNLIDFEGAVNFAAE